MVLNNNDRTVLKLARKMVMEWVSAPDHVKDALNAIIEGMPMNEIEPSMKKQLAKMAERIEDCAMEIEADRLEEAAYILKNALIYGEDSDIDGEIEPSEINEDEFIKLIDKQPQDINA